MLYLLYYCEVRWFSRGAMFHPVYALCNELAMFVVQKGFNVPEVSDPAWLLDLAFVVDILKPLNALNI